MQNVSVHSSSVCLQIWIVRFTSCYHILKAGIKKTSCIASQQKYMVMSCASMCSRLGSNSLDKWSWLDLRRKNLELQTNASKSQVGHSEQCFLMDPHWIDSESQAKRDRRHMSKETSTFALLTKANVWSGALSSNHRFKSYKLILVLELQQKNYGPCKSPQENIHA